MLSFNPTPFPKFFSSSIANAKIGTLLNVVYFPPPVANTSFQEPYALFHNSSFASSFGYSLRAFLSKTRTASYRSSLGIPSVEHLSILSIAVLNSGLVIDVVEKQRASHMHAHNIKHRKRFMFVNAESQTNRRKNDENFQSK